MTWHELIVWNLKKYIKTNILVIDIESCAKIFRIMRAISRVRTDCASCLLRFFHPQTLLASVSLRRHLVSRLCLCWFDGYALRFISMSTSMLICLLWSALSNLVLKSIKSSWQWNSRWGCNKRSKCAKMVWSFQWKNEEYLRWRTTWKA